MRKDVSYLDVSNPEDFATLAEGVRHDLQRGWERAQVLGRQVSSLYLALNQWGGARERDLSRRDMLKQWSVPRCTSGKGCAGLEPRHTLLGDEYIRQLLSIGRLVELASGMSRCQVWGRNGGKLLLLSPSVPVAVSLLRGTAHLYGVTFDTLFGLPGSEGAEGGGEKPGPGMTTQPPQLGVSHESLGDGSPLLAEAAAPEELRTWLKEKLYQAVSEPMRLLLCLPPAVLEQQELMAVLHEVFAQDGPPEGWYSEREVKDMESAVSGLELEQRLLPPAAFQEEESNLILPPMEQFWIEALGRVHIVLLGSTCVPDGRLQTSQQFGAEMLDACCPGLLQQFAVLHMGPLDKQAYIGAAKIQLSSPMVDPASWQPVTPYRSQISPDTLSEAATSLIEAARHVSEKPPAGIAPKCRRSAQDLHRSNATAGDCESAAPRAAAASSAWAGEGVDTGLGTAHMAGLGDLGDLLSLTQNLCHRKGEQLAARYSSMSDAHRLLEQLSERAAASSGSELSKRTQEAQAVFEEAQAKLVEKLNEHGVHSEQLETLREEVIGKLSSTRIKYEAAESLIQSTKQDMEMNRIALINFSKQDSAELKRIVQQHFPPGDENNEPSPVVALFGLCCQLLRVSATPSRDELRNVVGDPLFATKLAAMDIDAVPQEYLEHMQENVELGQEATESQDSKVLFMISNVVFPAYKYASTVRKLPEMMAELEFYTQLNEARGPEVEEMQKHNDKLHEDLRTLQARADELLQEVQNVETIASNAADRRGRMEKLSNGLRLDRVRWNWELEELASQLSNLVGDCLLSAAASLYLGPWGRDHRQQLLQHWKAILWCLGVSHSQDLDLASYWTPASALFRWCTELGLPQDSHLQESIVLASLQNSKWPIFYDPDGFAGEFLEKLYPGSTRLTMNAPDFTKDLHAALSISMGLLSTLGSGAPEEAEQPISPQVIIIDNAYLPAIRETELLTELLSRRQLSSAGIFSEGDPVPLAATGPEGSVVNASPKLVLIFVTNNGEHLSRDLMSMDFSLIDFRLYGAPRSEGPVLELVTEQIFQKAMPSVYQEWKQLHPERAQLVDEWQRLNDELAVKLAAHHKSISLGQCSQDTYPSDDQVRELMTPKADMDGVGRRLLKSRDHEAKLLHQRSSYEILTSCICSLASAVEQLYWLCPSSSLSLPGLLRLVSESLPMPPSENSRAPRIKTKGDDLDWAGLARRQVLGAVWKQVQSGLPEQLVLPAAVRLSVASAVPHAQFQEVFSQMLLQCPAADPTALGMDLSPGVCEALEALLDGESLKKALKLFRTSKPEMATAPPTKRASVSSRASVGSVSSMLSLAGAQPTPKVRASVAGHPVAGPSDDRPSASSSAFRSGVSKVMAMNLLGVFAGGKGKLSAPLTEQNEEDDDKDSQPSRPASRGESLKPEVDVLRSEKEGDGELRTPKYLLRRLFVMDSHMEKCQSKSLFLARFCYFQEAMRNLLERFTTSEDDEEVEDQEGMGPRTTKDVATMNLQDLFQVSRVANDEDAARTEEYLEDLLHALQANIDSAGRTSTSEELRVAKSQRSTLLGEMDPAQKRKRAMTASSENEPTEEGVSDNSQDAAQALALVFQFFANGGRRSANLTVSVEWLFMTLVADRLEESVGEHPESWARWADFIASGGLRAEDGRSGFGHAPGLIEHLPVLGSIPQVLLSEVMPQAGNGFALLTLKQTVALAATQALVLSVLASHSVGALLAGLEAMVAGLVGEQSAPSRGSHRLKALVSSTVPAQPLLCFCESTASSVHDQIFKLANQAPGGRKVIQLAFTGVSAMHWAVTGKAGEDAGQHVNSWAAIGPAAGCATTHNAILDLVEECKDVGYWLVIYVTPGGSRSIGPEEAAGVNAVEWSCYELLEWVWFSCNTSAFASTCSDRFRLFVVIDSRVAHLLPRWLFSGRPACFFDGQTGLQLRPWFEQFVGSMQRRTAVPAPGVAPTTYIVHKEQTNITSGSGQTATTSTAASATLPAEPLSVSSAFSSSPLQGEARPQQRPVLSRMIHGKQMNADFVLKLGATSLRLAIQLVLSTLAACDRSQRVSPLNIVRSSGIGSLDAEMADEAVHQVLMHATSFYGGDVVAHLRLVDILEVVCALVLRQGDSRGACWVDLGSSSGPAASPLLYNLLRHYKSYHLSKLRPEMMGQPPVDPWFDSLGDEPAVARGGRRNSRSSITGDKRKKKFSTAQEAVDEVLWFHNELYEPTTRSLAAMFSHFVEALDRLLRDEGAQQLLLNGQNVVRGETSEDETKLLQAVQALPMLHHQSTFRQFGACQAMFLTAMSFASPLRGDLNLPLLPRTGSVSQVPQVSTPLDVPAQQGSSTAPAASPRSASDSMLQVLDEASDENDQGEDEEHKQEVLPPIVSVVAAEEDGPIRQDSEKNSASNTSVSDISDGRSKDLSAMSDGSQGILAEELVDVSTSSVSREALQRLLEATVVCIESSPLHIAFNPNDSRSLASEKNENALQAEWRRQRHSVAHWARSVLGEAKALLRGMIEGLDAFSPRLWLKLRHMLHCAEVWALRGQPEGGETLPSPPSCWVSSSEVWEAAASPAAATLPVPHGWQMPGFREEGSLGMWLARTALQLHEVHAKATMPKVFHVAEHAQIEPILFALRLELAQKLRVPVENTCLTFEPTQLNERAVGESVDETTGEKPAEQSPEKPPLPEKSLSEKPVALLLPGAGLESQRSLREERRGSAARLSMVSRLSSISHILSGEDEKAVTWDELDRERSPTYKATHRLNGLLALSQQIGEAPASSTGDTEGEGELPVRRKSQAARRSVMKVRSSLNLLAGASLKQQRKSTVKGKARDTKIVQKEITSEDIVLVGLLAEGAVWSAMTGLHIDPEVPGITRLPALRVRASTPRVAEILLHQSFMQAHGCVNLPVHRVLGRPWPPPSAGTGVLQETDSAEICTVTLPCTWAEPSLRWQPVALLDGLPPEPPDGHLGRWPPGDEMGAADDMDPLDLNDRLQMPLPVSRPFGLHPVVLPVLAGPAIVSRQKEQIHETSIE
eukprot:TRINITY_DN27572_c0_g1_i1.p1 TRINITY_DN27572_c0_g1~~TRINITY_DN27572_c0_g1_i1.p1  ORF type:complete len:3015 (-),score=633.85 TRINITY_DN27572_c0_g1_i1:78-9122(-)